MLSDILPDATLAFSLALLLGLMNGINVPASYVFSVAIILFGMFGAYSLTLPRRQNMRRGLLMGVLIGASVGAVGVWLDEVIADIPGGIWLGGWMGFCLGALVGLVSRVEYNDQDRLLTKLFLLVGSVLIGAALGAGVGIITGFILGGVAQSQTGLFLALLASAVVGGYLGSSFQQKRWIMVGAAGGVGVTAVSLWLGGAFAGMVLGSIAGSLAPMLLVAVIGAVGGLLARGFRAMIVEALEAPAEMMEQGAAPFLLPAVITGAVVGSSAAGPEGMVLLVGLLGLMGLLFGVMTDVNGRSETVLTVRALVEMAMIGSDDWPIMRTVGLLAGDGWRRALLGGVGGVLLGILGAGLGIAIIVGLFQLNL